MDSFVLTNFSENFPANRRYILESVQRTKLDFDFVDGLDYHCDYEEEWEDEVEGHEQNLSQTNLMEVPTNKRIRFCLNTSGKYICYLITIEFVIVIFDLT